MYYDESIEINFKIPEFLKEAIDELIKARKENQNSFEKYAIIMQYSFEKYAITIQYLFEKYEIIIQYSFEKFAIFTLLWYNKPKGVRWKC